MIGSLYTPSAGAGGFSGYRTQPYRPQAGNQYQYNAGAGNPTFSPRGGPNPSSGVDPAWFNNSGFNGNFAISPGKQQGYYSDRYKTSPGDVEGPNTALKADLELRNALELLKAKGGQEQDSNWWSEYMAKLGYDHDREMQGQKGAYDQLQSIIGRGYIDSNQAQSALSRFAGIQNSINTGREGLASTRTRANSLADNGLYTDGEEADFHRSFDPAQRNAMDLAQTGGISEMDWQQLMAQYAKDRQRTSRVADRGELSQGEYDQDLASTMQEVTDAHRKAATSTYGNANLSGSPFAAASIMAKGAGEAGKARASKRTELNRYQAETRSRARGQLSEQQQGEAQTRLGRGQNRIQGQAGLNDALQILSRFMESDAGGKVQGIEQLLKLSGMENDLTGREMELAGNQSKIDMSTMPDFIRQLFDRAGKATEGYGTGKGTGQGGSGGYYYGGGGSGRRGPAVGRITRGGTRRRLPARSTIRRR